MGKRWCKGDTLTVIVSTDETEINLLFIYDKAERATISREKVEYLLLKNSFKQQ